MVDVDAQLAEAEAAGDTTAADTADTDSLLPESPKPVGRPKGSKNRTTGTRVRASRTSAATVSVPKRDHHASEKKATTGTDAERRESLAASFSGLWDAAAEMFDDPLLKVTDQEAHEWANPVQRALKQVHQDHHIEKLAPLEAVGVTFRIAAPRVKRIVVNRAGQSATSRPAPQFKGFRRAEPEPEPEPSNGQVSGPVAFDPGIGANFDKPIPFDPSQLTDQ